VNALLGFPIHTELNKRIPKQKFYDNLSVTPALKKVFIEQVNAIYWRNKIATSTLNVASGERVTEIEVFELRLNQQKLDTTILQLIDKEIPYHILFILSFEDMCQVWIGYKEANAVKSGNFKVGSYFHTDWVKTERLSLRLEGLTIDAIYDNLVRQIAPQEVGGWSAENGVKRAVEQYEQKQKLLKEIAALEKKVQIEKQFNRQVEMNEELKEARKALEVLSK